MLIRFRVSRRIAWIIAHGGVAGTNNNSGTEGGWGGMKKDVVGTAGSTNALPVGTIVPSTVRYITNKSKEQASFWKKNTAKRAIACTYTFPSLPWPLRKVWEHLDHLHPMTFVLSFWHGSLETESEWSCVTSKIAVVADVDGGCVSPVHTQIRAFHNDPTSPKIPARRSMTHIIIPSTKYLNSILGAEERNMTRYDIGVAIIISDTGCCGHTTAMALLYDPSLEFPAKYSGQKLQQVHAQAVGMGFSSTREGGGASETSLGSASDGLG